MNARQKFWLKVALAVTFPVWLVPATALGSVALLARLVWMACCGIVDNLTEPHA